jgi:hypothetical protein
MPYNYSVMEETVSAIANETSDLSEAETLIKIARWESGGFRKDIADCRVLGDHGAARGLFQVHPINKEEMVDTCSKDYRKQVQVALTHLRDSVEVCKMHGYRGSDLRKALAKFIYTEYNVIISKKGVVQYASNTQTE